MIVSCSHHYVVSFEADDRCTEAVCGQHCFLPCWKSLEFFCVCVPFSVLLIPGYRSLIWIVLRLVLGSSSPSCDRHGLVKLFGAMNPREYVPRDIRERFLCS